MRRSLQRHPNNLVKFALVFCHIIIIIIMNDNLYSAESTISSDTVDFNL